VPLNGEYLGMKLSVDDSDRETLEYFRYLGAHDFRLQQCANCKLLRFPPSTGCPWCAEPSADWTPVEGRGTVHSYSEVHHAVQGAYRERLPYLLLLVELDAQKGKPTEHEALRLHGNLVTARGELAPAELRSRIGIGSRVRMIFQDVGPEMALPQWTLDEQDERTAVWRYPGR
jgi:uncharacterized OB-fold protein